MNTYLFHTEVFMPQRFQRPLFEGRLRYGPHALSEAKSDRYGGVPLPEFFEACNAKLIEVEFDIDRDEVCKQVWRQALDSKRDIILVMGRGGFVRTVWVNLRNDKHRTLDRSKYVRA